MWPGCTLEDVPTAAFTTLGCKVNQYETQRILDSFEQAGFSIVPFESPADVYVINTCSVTSIAESKSRYTIRRAIRSNPAAKVVVTGCAAQMALNRRESVEGAHVVVPNPEKLATLEHFFRAFPGFESAARRAAAAPQRPPTWISGRTRATLKVQDGCSVLCSYCSIPFTRPGMTSRPADEILAEAARMTALGYREIVLTGVLIGAYGPETGSGGPTFEHLVELLAHTDGLERLRISSIELRHVTPRLIELISRGLVVPHLHIPLQSGDDQVLADMNRPYRRADYLGVCRDLVAAVPEVSITTDIMVGFPTETEERFVSTVAVCEEVRYLKVHSFRYSPRFGTRSEALGDRVSPEEKQRRSQVLAQVSARTGDAHRRRFLGQRMRVLVERKSPKDGLLEGLTDNYLEVRFAGPTNLVRNTAMVKLDACRDGVIYAELSGSRASDIRVV